MCAGRLGDAAAVKLLKPALTELERARSSLFVIRAS
jgi:hypothetical protein